jgi:hypothetical protein
MGDRARVVSGSRGCAAVSGWQTWSQSAGRAPSPARCRPSPLTSANEQYAIEQPVRDEDLNPIPQTSNARYSASAEEPACCLVPFLQGHRIST